MSIEDELDRARREVDEALRRPIDEALGRRSEGEAERYYKFHATQIIASMRYGELSDDEICTAMEALLAAGGDHRKADRYITVLRVLRPS